MGGVIYTVLFGKDPKPPHGHFKTEGFEDIEFLFVTDSDKDVPSPWKKIERKPEGDPRVANRRYKLIGENYVPELRRADWVIYMDASLFIKELGFVREVEGWLKDRDVAMMRHPRRDNPTDEAHECLRLGKYDQETHGRVLPDTRGIRGLWNAGFLVRRPEATLMRLWWNDLAFYKCYRDQVILPITLARTGQEIHSIDLLTIKQNPWFWRWHSSYKFEN